MRERTDLENLLDEKIPRDCVSTRDAGGGRKLSYLEGHYVIDRLNKVFGNLGWDSETVELVEVQGQDKPTYRCKVRIKALVQVEPGKYLNVVKEGTGYGRDKSTLNAHEMALKEAETDALKRAAMKFGMSIGLALYDKSQENVEEEDKNEAQPVPEPVQRSAKIHVGRVLGEPAKAVGVRERINEHIKKTGEILKAKGMTVEEQKALMEPFGAKLSDLSDEQANNLLAILRGKLNG